MRPKWTKVAMLAGLILGKKIDSLWFASSTDNKLRRAKLDVYDNAGKSTFYEKTQLQSESVNYH